MVLLYMKDDRVAEILFTSLKNDDVEIRRGAATILGCCPNLKAAVPLIAALRDSDTLVRQAAARSLGTVRDIGAVEPLIAALSDPDGNVRREAADALRMITAKNLGPDPAKWQKWKE